MPGESGPTGARKRVGWAVQPMPALYRACARWLPWCRFRGMGHTRSLPISNTGIDIGIGYISDEAGDESACCHEQADCLHDWEIPRQDGVDRQATNAGDRKDGLGDDCAAEEAADLKSD